MIEYLNLSRIAALRFDGAIAYMSHLQHDLIEFLKRFARTVRLELLVESGDGSVRIFARYRVQLNRVGK